jgi:hypothetical protein
MCRPHKPTSAPASATTKEMRKSSYFAAPVLGSGNTHPRLNILVDRYSVVFRGVGEAGTTVQWAQGLRYGVLREIPNRP